MGMNRKLGRLALLAAAGLCLFVIQLPLIMVVWLSFFKQEIPVLPPTGYSLQWFARIPENNAFVSGFLLSLQISVVATMLGILISVPAALVIARRRTRFGGGILMLLLFPMMVPNVVMGAAIYIGEIEGEILTGFPLIGSTFGLMIAHMLLVIPWAVRLIVVNLSNIGPGPEEAAQSLGATPWITFRKILLPALRPSLVAASLFGFVVSFGNLELSMFLVAPGRTTLPIAIMQYLEWKLDPTVAAVSTVQIVIVALALFLTNRYVKLTQVI